MADYFKPKPIDLSKINGSKRYANGDIVDAEAINAPIEAAAFFQYIATNQPDTSNANNVGIPKVSIVYDSDGVPMLKFENLKGAPGFSPTATAIPIENGYQITITDIAGSKTFNLYNGDKGDKGDSGRGISSVEYDVSYGIVDLYKIHYTDGTTSTFKITNGAQGNGISDIIHIRSDGLEDTYEIRFTNGTTYQYTVRNGKTPIKFVDYWNEEDIQLVEALVNQKVAEGLGGKVDKTTEANKIYGTDDVGNQTTHSINDFAKRQPHTFNMYTVLGYKSAPEETTFQMTKNPTPYTIAYRDGSGNFNVNEPISDKNPAPKSYVDKSYQALAEKQNALEGRVAELESLTLSYPEIASTDYEAIVPANVGKYALIKSFGGATEKISSKNLIDPSNITVLYKGGSSGGVIPSTIDTNGFITFTVKYEYGLGAAIYIYMPKGEARYYYLIEGDTPSYIYGYGEALEIEFNLPEGEEYGDQWYADEATFTFRIMAFIKEGDTEYGWEVAPEGTVFEPYFEPYLVNAKVERIESIGANLFDGSLINCKTEVGITVKYDSETQIFTINGKAGRAHNCSQTYINLKGEKGEKYVLKAEIVGGTIDSPKGVAVAYFGSSDTPNKITNWSAPSLLLTSDYRVATLPHEYITAFWFYISEGSTLNNLQVKIMLARADSDVPYKPHKSEPIDSITIPEAVRSKEGYGIDKNYIRWIYDKVEFVKAKRKVILNSTNQTWESFAQTSGMYMAKFADAKQSSKSSDCTAFTNVSWDERNIIGNYTDHPTSGYKYFMTDKATLAEFKAWLDEKEASGNPVILEYELAESIVTNITDLFTEDNSIEVEGGGTIRFVNENELSVPNTIGYVTRKE